jgi:hypothetical protein
LPVRPVRSGMQQAIEIAMEYVHDGKSPPARVAR